MRLDTRALGAILGATLVGALTGYLSMLSTGGVRDDSVVRQLVWTIFAVPFLVFLAWALTRRHELGLAAFTCFCLYFFTPFVAARIETVVAPGATVANSGHVVYFTTAVILHSLAGVAIAIWRARAGRPTPTSPAQQPRSA